MSGGDDPAFEDGAGAVVGERIGEREAGATEEADHAVLGDHRESDRLCVHDELLIFGGSALSVGRGDLARWIASCCCAARTF